MSPENFVKAQIAAYAFEQAGHFGSYDGMLAVACVLRNRVKAGWFGGDWLRVINHAAESDAFMPRPASLLASADLSSQDFRRVLSEVDDIFLGIFSDKMTDSGLYFMDLLYVNHDQSIRPWFAHKILKDPANHRRIAQVGMLQIFS